jgi:hypothetical protein
MTHQINNKQTYFSILIGSITLISTLCLIYVFITQYIKFFTYFSELIVNHYVKENIHTKWVYFCVTETLSDKFISSVEKIYDIFKRCDFSFKIINKHDNSHDLEFHLKRKQEILNIVLPVFSFVSDLLKMLLIYFCLMFFKSIFSDELSCVDFNYYNIMCSAIYSCCLILS